MDKFTDWKISLDKVKSQVVALSIKQGLIKTNDKYPTTQNIKRWFRDYFEPDVLLTDIGSVLKKSSTQEMEVFHNGLDGAVKSNSNSSFSGEESDFLDRKAHEYVNDMIDIVQNSSSLESSCRTNPSSLLNSSRVILKHKLDDLITDTEIEKEDKSIKVPALVLKHIFDDSVTDYITKSNYTEIESDCTNLNTPLVPNSDVWDIYNGENKNGNHAQIVLDKDRNVQLAFNKDKNHDQLTLYNSNREIPGHDQKGKFAAQVVESQTGNGNQLNTETVNSNPKQRFIKKTSLSGDKNINVNCLDISFPGITDNKAIEKEIYNEVVEEMEAIKQKVFNVNIQSSDIVDESDLANINPSSIGKGGANTDVNKKYYHEIKDSIDLEYSDSDLVIDETAMAETHDPEVVKIQSVTHNPEAVNIQTLTHNPEAVKIHTVTHDPEAVNILTVTHNPEAVNIQTVTHNPEAVNIQTVTHDPEPVNIQTVTHNPEAVKIQTVTHDPEAVNIQTVTHNPEAVKIQTVTHDPEAVNIQTVTHNPEAVNIQTVTHNPEAVNIQTVTHDPEPVNIQTVTHNPEAVNIQTVTHNPEAVNIQTVTHNPEAVNIQTVTHNPEAVNIQTVTHNPEAVNIQTVTYNPEAVKIQTVNKVDSKVESKENGALDGNCKITKEFDGNIRPNLLVKVNKLKTTVNNIIEVSANFDSNNKQSNIKSEPQVIVNTDDVESFSKIQDQDKLVMCQEYDAKSPIYDSKSKITFEDNFAPTIFSTVTMKNSDFDEITDVNTTEISELEVKKVDSCSVFDFTEEHKVCNDKQNILDIDILKEDKNRIGKTEKHEQKVGFRNLNDNTLIITKDKQDSRKKRVKAKKHKNGRFVALSQGLENKMDKRSPSSKSSLFGARLVIKQDKIVVQNSSFQYIVNAGENKDDNTDIFKSENVSHQGNNTIENGDKISIRKNVTDNITNVNGYNVKDNLNIAQHKGSFDDGYNVDVNGKKATHPSDITSYNNKGEIADKAAGDNSKSINRSKPLKKRKLTTQVLDMLNEKETTLPTIQKCKQSNPPENPSDKSFELNTPDRLMKVLADQKLRRHSLHRVHYVKQGRNKARLKPGTNIYKKLKLSHRVGDQKYVEHSELSPKKKSEVMSDDTTGSNIQKENREILPVASAFYQQFQVKAIGQTLQGTDKTTPKAATVMPTLIPVTLIPRIPQTSSAPLVMNPISSQNHSLQLQPALSFEPMTAIPFYHGNQISSLASNSIPYQTNVSKALANVQIPAKPQQQLIRTAILQPYVNAQPINYIIPHPHMITEQGNMNRTLLTSNNSQSIVNAVGQPISYISANTQVVPLTPTYNTVTPNPYRRIAPAPNGLAIEPVYHAQTINPSMPMNPICATQPNHTIWTKPMASITPMSSIAVGHSQTGSLKCHSSQQIAPNKKPVSLTENDTLQIVISSPPIEHKTWPNVSIPNAVPSTDAVQLLNVSSPQIVSVAGPVQPRKESNTVAVQSNEHTSLAIPSKEHTRPQFATSPLATVNVTAPEQSPEATPSNVSQVNKDDTSSVAKDKTNTPFNPVLNIDEDEFDNLKKLVKEYKKIEIMCLKLQELEEVKMKELNFVTRKKQSTIRKLYDIKKTLQTITLKASVRDISVVTQRVNQLPPLEDDLALNLSQKSEEEIIDNLTSQISSNTKEDMEKQNETKVKENAGIQNNGNNLVSGIIEHCCQGSNISDQESHVFHKMIDHTERSSNMKENQYEQRIPQNIKEINTDREDINTPHFVDNIVNQLLQEIVETVSATSNDKEVIHLGTNDDIEEKIKTIPTETKMDPTQSSTKISEESSSTEKLVQSSLSAAIGSPSGTSHRVKKRGRPQKHCYGHKFIKHDQDQRNEYQNNLQLTKMSDSMLTTELSRNPNEINQVESARKLDEITSGKSIAPSNHRLPSENPYQHPPQDKGRNQAYANLPFQYRPPDDPPAHQRSDLHNVPFQPNLSPNIPRVQSTIHQNNDKFLTFQAKYWQQVGFKRGLNHHNQQQPLHRQPPPNQYTPNRYDYQPPRHHPVHTQDSTPGYNYPYRVNPRFPQERSYPQLVQQLPHQHSIAPRGPPAPVNANHHVIHHNEDAPNGPEMYRPTHYQYPQQKIQPSPPQPVIEPQNQAFHQRVFQNQGHVMPSTHPNLSPDVRYQQRQFTLEYRPQELQVRSQQTDKYRVPQDQHVQHERQLPNHQHSNLYAKAQPQIHKGLQSPNFTVVNNHINNAGINHEMPLQIPEMSNYEPTRDVLTPNGEHIIQVVQNKPKKPVTYSNNPTGSIEVKQQIVPSGAIAAIIKTNGPADKERIMMQTSAQYPNDNIQHIATKPNISNNLTTDVTNKKPPPYQEVIHSRTRIVNNPSIIICDDEEEEEEEEEEVNANKAFAGTGDNIKIGFLKCSHCDKEASCVCSGCKKTTYCSNQCQNDAWKSHFKDCAK